MNNLQFTIYNFKRKFLASLILSLIINFTFLIINCPARAQSLGLSITPPINEIMIIPGKTVTQTFTITNDGEDGMASVYIIPFDAQGENGNPLLDEENAITGSHPFASWFSIISPVSSFGEKFYMAGGAHQDVLVKISPPSNASEKDYYFTLLYELGNDVPGGITPTGPTNQARIGSNLLISVSKDGNPEKMFEITEFSAPKIIDSLGKLDFSVRIGNLGSYLFKSNGQITIKPWFEKEEALTLAPLNVISDSVRNIPCLKDEETISCEASYKVLVGIYKSTLEVSPDGETDLQKETITTIAFPFSIIFVFIFIFAILNIIKNTKNKARNPLDNN